MALTPGTRLGPYEILAPLGAGGMGEVYRARDTRLDREVAVKVLPERLAADAEALARFQREAKAVAALSHPNILAIHDFGAEGGTSYSVTEMLEGHTLRERLGGSPLPVRKAVDYARQIAAGLAAAHDRGVVHRDLKPENLFVTGDGRVKILDFGLAKLAPLGADGLTASPTLDAGTQPGTVMGTMGYMSPEQVRAQQVDHRSDVFTFGAILYEMLSGRRAFSRATAADTMSAILKEDPPDLSGTNPGVPPALERLTAHCLEKNPAERFQSAHDLAFSLEAVTLAPSSSDLPAIPGPAGQATPHRRHVPLGVAIGLAAGFLIGAAGTAWLGRSPAAAPPTLRHLTYSGIDRDPSPSSDGRLIAYTSHREGRSQIWLKQHPGGDEVALTDGPRDERPRISPDGSQVLFVRGEAGDYSLYRIPIVGGEPRRILDDAYDGDWSPDGRSIAFLRRHREQQFITDIVGLVEANGEGAREIRREGRGRLDYPRWSPDGSTIAVILSQGENAPNSILLVDVARKEARDLVAPPPAGFLSAAAWSGEGRSLVYAQSESFVTAGARGGSGRIIRQEVASGRTETLMWIPTIPPVIDILGRGSLVLGATQQRQNLHEAALAGGLAAPGRRWLTRGNSIDRQPAFSPDGQWVLFTSNRSGNLDLWKLNTATGAVRRITEDAADDWDPAFMPDGRQIVWSSSRTGHFEIWICSADGTGARRLTDDGFDAENPTATPDGRWVVYNSINAAHPGIWKIRPDGSDATRIVPGTWSTPDVSPDGSFVAFRTGTLPRSVYVARVADGTILPHPIPLPGQLFTGRPRWDPHGRRLLFTGTAESGALSIFAQAFSTDEDTSATRKAVAVSDTGANLETFGVSADGTRLVYSEVDQTDSLMMAEGLPGIEPPRRAPR